MDVRDRGPYGAAMRGLLLLGLALAVVVGFGVAALAEMTRTAPAGWSDPAAHVVDGRWVGTETACPLEGGQGCSLALDAALERVAMIEPGATVTSASVAQRVGAYRDGRGGTVLATTSGWVTYTIAILGFADGRGLMVGVHCEPLKEYEGGTIPATCQADAGEISAPRVGEEPWLRSD